MEIQNKFIVAKDGKVGRMRIFNEIDSNGYTLDRFLAEFDMLQNDDSIDEISILINSLGGSVFKGFPIITAISESTKKVTTTIDAVGASMAALIWLSGHERKLYDYSQVMLHAARYPDGSPADDALNNVNDGIYNLVKSVTRRAKDKIRSWLSQDTWFTAEQAIKEGLAHEVIKSRLSLSNTFQSEIRNMVASARPIDDINHLKSKHETMDKLYSLLNLSVEAGDEAVEEKIKEIQNSLEMKVQEITSRDTKINELEAKVKKFEDAEKAKRENEITSLVEAAFTARQITADNKAIWKTILTNDFENGSKAIAALPKAEEKLTKSLNTDSSVEAEAKTFELNPVAKLMQDMQEKAK